MPSRTTLPYAVRSLAELDRPTFTRAFTSIEPTDRTVEMVGPMLEAMIDGFIAKVRLANRFHH